MSGTWFGKNDMIWAHFGGNCWKFMLSPLFCAVQTPFSSILWLKFYCNTLFCVWRTAFSLFSTVRHNFLPLTYIFAVCKLNLAVFPSFLYCNTHFYTILHKKLKCLYHISVLLQYATMYTILHKKLKCLYHKNATLKIINQHFYALF